MPWWGACSAWRHRRDRQPHLLSDAADFGRRLVPTARATPTSFAVRDPSSAGAGPAGTPAGTRPMGFASTVNDGTDGDRRVEHDPSDARQIDRLVVISDAVDEPQTGGEQDRTRDHGATPRASRPTQTARGICGTATSSVTTERTRSNFSSPLGDAAPGTASKRLQVLREVGHLRGAQPERALGVVGLHDSVERGGRPVMEVGCMLPDSLER